MAADNFPGNCLDFDGSNDYVEIADNAALDLTSNYTIEAWIRIDSFSSMAGIVSKYQTSGANGYFLRLSSDTGLTFDEVSTANGILEANQWYHVVAVNDNGTRRLYLNGVSQTLSGTPLSVQGNTNPLRIGVDYSDREFDGRIDEVRLWNDVRTEQEVRENMHLTLAGNETGLVCYWQFNESTGTAASDATGNHHGTLHNMSQCWIDSSVPTGGGTSNTQTETPGVVTFTDTDLSMDFTTHNSTSITVTKIDLAPNIAPGLTAYDNQYWAVNRFGTGSFDADLTFTVSEDLTADDESNPTNIVLFKRDSNLDGAWILAANASSVNAANNTATFDNITAFSQFIIGKPYFTDINAGLTGVWAGSVAWGDYDNDGDLDILLTGDAGDGGTNKISNVYENEAGIFSDINAGLTEVNY